MAADTVAESHLPGWSADGLARAHAYFQGLRSTAVVILHRGETVARWGDTTRPADVA